MRTGARRIQLAALLILALSALACHPRAQKPPVSVGKFIAHYGPATPEYEDFRAGRVTTSFIEERPQLLTARQSADRGTRLLTYLADQTVNKPNGERPKTPDATLKLPKLPKDAQPAPGHPQPEGQREGRLHPEDEGRQDGHAPGQQLLGPYGARPDRLAEDPGRQRRPHAAARRGADSLPKAI